MLPLTRSSIRECGTLDQVFPEPTAEQLRAALHLQNLRDTYPDIDRWRERSRAVEEPQRGSQLELDGRAVRDLGHTLAGQARQALLAGTQHLSLARDAIESAKELYPIAHPTLIRGALFRGL